MFRLGCKRVHRATSGERSRSRRCWRCVAAHAAAPQILALEGDLEGVHDPAVITAGDTYYVFSTVGGRPGAGVLPIRTSYLDRSGTPMTAGGGTLVIEATTPAWRGPGHNSVLQDRTGDYLFFHAYDGLTGRPRLHISTIVWEHDWPRAGALP